MGTATLPPAKAAAVQRAVSDPSLFARTILQHDVWSKQHEILQSIAHHPRTAVKACHSSGKTFCAAEVVLWWLARYQDGIVVTTAPTDTQVRTLLWGEIHSALGKCKLNFPPAKQTELRIGPKRFALGFTTRGDTQEEGVRFQGFHGGHVLVILDEAPGVHPKIWEAVEGIRAGGDVRLLVLGNPTISSGPFYDAFHAHRAGWSTHTISAFDTPNLAGLKIQHLLAMSQDDLDINLKPYLTTRRWVRERYEEWGENHPLWQARVLGQFPEQSEDALISLAWLEAAKYVTPENETGKLTAGIDVSGPGEDETVLVLRRGAHTVSVQAWADKDPRGKVVAALMPHRPNLEAVNVDSIGIGEGMARHLEDLHFPVVDVNVGRATRDPEKFANLKAELYWGLRLRAQCGEMNGITDEKTIGQLAGIRYKHNARGQIVIESKEDARKRGVKSPDRAEAVMLAFAPRLAPAMPPLISLTQSNHWSV